MFISSCEVFCSPLVPYRALLSPSLHSSSPRMSEIQLRLQGCYPVLSLTATEHMFSFSCFPADLGSPHQCLETEGSKVLRTQARAQEGAMLFWHPAPFSNGSSWGCSLRSKTPPGEGAGWAAERSATTGGVDNVICLGLLPFLQAAAATKSVWKPGRVPRATEDELGKWRKNSFLGSISRFCPTCISSL